MGVVAVHSVLFVDGGPWAGLQVGAGGVAQRVGTEGANKVHGYRSRTVNDRKGRVIRAIKHVTEGEARKRGARDGHRRGRGNETFAGVAVLSVRARPVGREFEFPPIGELVAQSAVEVQ